MLAALALVGVLFPSDPECTAGWWQGFGAPLSMPDHWAIGRALEHADLGSGPEWWVGGTFNYSFFPDPLERFLARRTAAGWDSAGGGANSHVFDLHAADLGTGPRMYAVGAFTEIGGVAANRIAVWDGQGWSPLASGLDASGTRLATFDDGTGAALYVAGAFLSAGGVLANRVARWDGTQWSALAGGVDGSARAFAVHDDGAGPALFVGGSFTSAGGSPASGIARWNGSAWDGLDPTLPMVTVGRLVSHDFGAGPRLVASRYVIPASSEPAIIVWDGTAWTAIGSGASGPPPPKWPLAMASVDDGTGPVLWVSSADAPQWRRYAGGVWATEPANDWAEDMKSHGPPGAQTLYATGYFSWVDGDPSPFLAARHPCGDSANAKVVAGCQPPGFRIGVHAPSAPLGGWLPIGFVSMPRLVSATLFWSTGVLPSVAAGGCGLAIPSVGEVLLDGFALPLVDVAPKSMQSHNFIGSVGAIHFAVPPVPALAGATIAFQAMGVTSHFVPQIRLSDAVVVKFTP